MPRQIILDSNLLVLLVVGLTDHHFIAKHKRTATYTEKDFELLLRILAAFDHIVVTPNIVTEASNLLRQCANPMKSNLCRALASIVDQETEHYVPSIDAVKSLNFVTLGLTDSAILSVLETDMRLVTSDLDLYLAALAASKNVDNFNHLRFSGLYDA